MKTCTCLATRLFCILAGLTLLMLLPSGYAADTSTVEKKLASAENGKSKATIVTTPEAIGGLHDDFTNVAILDKLKVSYGGSVPEAAKRARRSIKDGSLIIEADFGADSGPNDTVKVCWGEGFGKSGAGDFSHVDLKDFPIFELRIRSGTAENLDFPLFIAFERENGERDYVYVNLSAEAGQWQSRRFRLAPDSVAPTAFTPRKVIGLLFRLESSGKPSRLEVDRVDIRAPLESEMKENEALKKLFSDYCRPQCKLFDTFFPWGIYTTDNVNRPFESWAGGYEGIFAEMAKNHVNFISINDEYEYGRLKAGKSEEGFRSFISEMNKINAEAESTGIRIVADIRRMMDGLPMEGGYEQLLPQATRLAEALRPLTAIVAYFLADEPDCSSMAQIIAIKRAMEKVDHERPGLTVFNGVPTMKAFNHYLTVNYWDNYPVHQGNRDPWRVGRRAGEYLAAAPQLPMWVVLQSFATTPEALNSDSYIRPSDAEMRLMTYLSLGYGAKGIIWYSWWTGSGSGELLGSRTAYTETSGMMRTVSELGERILPLAPLFLKCDATNKAPLRLSQDGTVTNLEPHADKGEHGLVALPLQNRENKLFYLVVVNEDLSSPHEGILKTDAPDLKIWDLSNLKPTPAKPDGFAIETLAGGDGRIYLLGSEDNFRSDSVTIRCAGALESLHVLKGDQALAERWGLKTDEVKKAFEDCSKAAKSRDAESALRFSSIARSKLEEAMKSDSLFHMSRTALEDMRLELTELARFAETREKDPSWWTGGNHVMLVPNRIFGKTSVRYWETGRRFDAILKRFRAGEKKDLWRDINQARTDLLEVRAELLADLARKLRGSAEAPK